MRLRPIEILLVEDNIGDARLAIEALKDARIVNTVHHVSDGDEALAYLRREPPFSEALPVDIVLLDLNLPRISGRDVLSAIRANSGLKKLPVIALTTSSAKSDIDYCYDNGANAFITKPVDFDQFYNAVKSFENFWLSVVALPGD
jgi:two-component system, chemotaxis family, response regulator Rcp1